MTLREVKSNIGTAQLQQKEAHREAEELQDERLHGVPDVEHNMKKVIPPSHSPLVTNQNVRRSRSATAAILPSGFEPITGRGGRVSDMRRRARVE